MYRPRFALTMIRPSVVSTGTAKATGPLSLGTSRLKLCIMCVYVGGCGAWAGWADFVGG